MSRIRKPTGALHHYDGSMTSATVSTTTAREDVNERGSNYDDVDMTAVVVVVVVVVSAAIVFDEDDDAVAAAAAATASRDVDVAVEISQEENDTEK